MQEATPFSTEAQPISPPCLARFTLRVAQGHFEVDRSTKLNVTVAPRVIYLASENHQAAL